MSPAHLCALMAMAFATGADMGARGTPRMGPETRQLRRYDGPRVEHVHAKGRGNGTRRSRKAARS